MGSIWDHWNDPPKPGQAPIHGTYCMMCGKEFFPTAEWVYRYKNKPVCSYTCCRKAERMTTAEEKRMQEEARATRAAKEAERLALLKQAQKDIPGGLWQVRQMRYKNGYSEEAWAMVEAAWREGKSTGSISRETGIKAENIRIHMKRYGVERGPKPCKAKTGE